jgi:SprT protein
MKESKASILQKYMPEAAAHIIAEWIDVYKCEFRISRSRSTKLGDYRAPFKDKGHRISVNHNLNHYSFLITTVHEFAHLITWNAHHHKVKPHGLEWKNNFKKLMIPFFDLDIFPTDVKKSVIAYLKNPAASSCTDANLFKTLRNYDVKDPDVLVVESIAENQHFITKNGRVFKKLNKIRTRYKCLEIKTGLMYLFNPLAEVKLLA